jgi:hypothetical protein
VNSEQLEKNTPKPERVTMWQTHFDRDANCFRSTALQPRSTLPSTFKLGKVAMTPGPPQFGHTNAVGQSKTRPSKNFHSFRVNRVANCLYSPDL